MMPAAIRAARAARTIHQVDTRAERDAERRARAASLLRQMLDRPGIVAGFRVDLADDGTVTVTPAPTLAHGWYQLTIPEVPA
jgi:hypothetical protein